MDERTRLLDVLQKRTVDRHPVLCPGGMMNMVVTELMDAAESWWPKAHSYPEEMARLTLAANRLAGIENVGVPFCMTVEAEAMGALIDMGSRSTEPRVASYAISHLDDVDRLPAIDVTKGRAKVCVEAVRILRQKLPGTPVIANLTGPVSLATSLIDPLLFYRAMITSKTGVHRLMKTVTRNLSEFGSALIEAGADLVCIADPSATGELLGRKSFSEFTIPYINELTVYFREKYKVPCIVHICGRIRPLGTVLSALEAEVLSVDSITSIKVLKEYAPDKIAMGNVSTYLLAEGDPERVLRSGKLCLKRGADILAPACGISPLTSIANIKALSRAVLDRD